MGVYKHEYIITTHQNAFWAHFNKNKHKFNALVSKLFENDHKNAIFLVVSSSKSGGVFSFRQRIFPIKSAQKGLRDYINFRN